MLKKNKIIIKLIFITFFLFPVIALAVEPLEMRSINEYSEKSAHTPITSEQIEIPAIQPKTISIEIINKDTAAAEKTSASVLEKIEHNAIPKKLNLGDAVDALFFIDVGFEMAAERIPSEKIMYSEFIRYYSLIADLYNNKMFGEVIKEVDNLLAFQLYGDGRLKLLFMKTAAALENDDVPTAQSTLAQISEIDRNKKFDAQRIYYYAKSLEKSENTDAAITEYLKLYKLYPQNNYADNSLFWVAKLFDKKEDFTTAQKYLDIVITDYAESDYADDALFFSAQLFDYRQPIKNYYRAEELYRQLYKTYPKSVYSHSAQERAKEIRKNYL